MKWVAGNQGQCLTVRRFQNPGLIWLDDAYEDDPVVVLRTGDGDSDHVPGMKLTKASKECIAMRCERYIAGRPRYGRPRYVTYCEPQDARTRAIGHHCGETNPGNIQSSQERQSTAYSQRTGKPGSVRRVLELDRAIRSFTQLLAGLRLIIGRSSGDRCVVSKGAAS
jgi:hypothetical protein